MRELCRVVSPRFSVEVSRSVSFQASRSWSIQVFETEAMNQSDATDGSAVASQPTGAVSGAAQTVPTTGYLCTCGCERRLPTQERVELHVRRTCWLCGKQQAFRKRFLAHEDSHLDPSTPSNTSRSHEVRCLGCCYKFIDTVRAPHWENHKNLNLCSRQFMIDRSVELKCAPGRAWENRNLGKHKSVAGLSFKAVASSQVRETVPVTACTATSLNTQCLEPVPAQGNATYDFSSSTSLGVSASQSQLMSMDNDLAHRSRSSLQNGSSLRYGWKGDTLYVNSEHENSSIPGPRADEPCGNGLFRTFAGWRYTVSKPVSEQEETA